MTDCLGVVVHSLDGSIVDWYVDPSEYVSGFMAAKHPGEVSQRFQSRVSCSPKQLVEVFHRPDSALVFPEPSKRLFQKTCSVGPEIHAFKIAKALLLFPSQISRVLKPHVLGPLEKLWILFSQALGFLFSSLVDRFKKMADDVEFVEHEFRIKSLGFGNIDVRHPHVAANALDPRGSLLAQLIEKCLQCLGLAYFFRPKKTPSGCACVIG